MTTPGTFFDAQFVALFAGSQAQNVTVGRLLVTTGRDSGGDIASGKRLG